MNHLVGEEEEGEEVNGEEKGINRLGDWGLYGRIVDKGERKRVMGVKKTGRGRRLTD